MPDVSMRTLVILRHAKSDYPPGVPDHDRPLAERGRRDAPVAGRWIAEHVGSVDEVVVSTATRTRQTWELAGAAVTVTGGVRFEDRVYEAAPADLLAVLRETTPEAATVVLVGHNPGCEMLAESLAGAHDDAAWDRMLAKYPTSGIAVLRFFHPWSDLAPGMARLEDFAVPRG